MIKDENIHALFTQEDNHGVTMGEYNETVKTYLTSQKQKVVFTGKSECVNNVKDMTYLYPMQLGTLPRNATINTIGINKEHSSDDKDRFFTVANLHLEGGRFVDMELTDAKIGDYLDVKTRLLDLVIKKNPYIICGDFNSVYSNIETYLDSMYEGQQTYFDTRTLQYKSEKDYSKATLSALNLELNLKCPESKDNNEYTLSTENIKKWNQKPFELLIKAHYKFISPGDKAISNSRGKNLIDHFWVKEELMESYDFEAKIYEKFGRADSNNLFGGVSDHKPVILDISVKPQSVKPQEGGKRIMSKNKRIVQKKIILGNELCIYKVPGSKKEHIKHKGKLITVTDYKKLMKSKK